MHPEPSQRDIVYEMKNSLYEMTVDIRTLNYSIHAVSTSLVSLKN